MAFTGDLGGTVAERPLEIAFAIQVELSTRVGCRSLGRSEGILREALTSLDTLHGLVRGALAAPAADGESPDAARVRACAEELADGVLGPFLAHWHPLFDALEAERPRGVALIEQEARWERADEFRVALAGLSEPLIRINRTLSDITGADLEPPLPLEHPPGHTG